MQTKFARVSSLLINSALNVRPLKMSVRIVSKKNIKSGLVPQLEQLEGWFLFVVQKNEGNPMVPSIFVWLE